MKTKTFQGRKNFAIADFKSAEENGVLRISGYANTKNVADRYGDVPTVYTRQYVYELGEYLKNPVLLLDHNWDVSKMAGKVTKINEDERGLYFEAEITASDLPIMAHVRQLIREGILKTVSIGGIWSYEDAQNPTHLTLAKIFEISLVAIPADTNAIVGEQKSAEDAPKTPETAPQTNEEEAPEEEAAQAEEAALEAANEKVFAFEAALKLSNFEAKTKARKGQKEQKNV